jgi:hypothetical protein
MRTSIKKRVNTLKASAKQRQAPVRNDQDARGADRRCDARLLGARDADVLDQQPCFELGASSQLLSSIDGARRQFVREGRELLDRAVGSARRLASASPPRRPSCRSSESTTSGHGVTVLDPKKTCQ